MLLSKNSGIFELDMLPGVEREIVSLLGHSTSSWIEIADGLSLKSLFVVWNTVSRNSYSTIQEENGG